MPQTLVIAAISRNSCNKISTIHSKSYLSLRYSDHIVRIVYMCSSRNWIHRTYSLVYFSFFLLLISQHIL